MEQTDKKPIIELQNISKSYYSETAVTQALRKVSLSFELGEFVAITGESGSGKSTLLNIIGGMDTFDEGEMYIYGEPTFQYDDLDWEDYRRTKIGYVFQDYSLIGHYSVLDNVMSALVIMGAEQDAAREMARKYLKQVGLDEYENHRATELSSGQKQRLSIARALAKNTDVIVADEPTGNLDSETGNQIISLLKELSKDHLVIMVTHNYDQAEAYVSRKIRIHDGQVISDVLVNQTDEKKPAMEREKLPAQEMNLRWQNRVAALFAKRNRKTQPGRAFLFTTFLFIISAASFLFIGELFLHKDDYHTRGYSNSVFAREDDTRISVKRADGKPITDEDLQKMASMRNVVCVDSCDLANDINFYLDEDKDYEYHYSKVLKRPVEAPSNAVTQTVSFENTSRFMKSTDCISEDDLAFGRMPEARNEIVLYASDDSRLGSSQKCYFTSDNLWQSGQYYFTDVTIVGILKEKTDDVYFSRALCQMLGNPSSLAEYRLTYAWDSVLKLYLVRRPVIPVINDSLKGNEVRASATDPYKDNDKMAMPPGASEMILSWQAVNEKKDVVGDPIEDTIQVQAERNEYTSKVLEMSQELFDKHYGGETYQASIYMTSYAKTDAILKALEKKGYVGVSTYRISTGEYLEDLVNQRLIIIGICAFGLIAILLAEILILRSLMRIRVKDYFVLKFIGMKMQVIKRISYFEMGGYALAAILLTLILAWILRFAGVTIIKDIMWYYTLIPYLLFALYNFLLIFLTVASFNRLLKGRLNQ